MIQIKQFTVTIHPQRNLISVPQKEANELYFIAILFIYGDNKTNIIYVVKNHQAPLYAESIAVNVNINVLIFILTLC